MRPFLMPWPPGSIFTHQKRVTKFLAGNKTNPTALSNGNILPTIINFKAYINKDRGGKTYHYVVSSFKHFCPLLDFFTGK